MSDRWDGKERRDSSRDFEDQVSKALSKALSERKSEFHIPELDHYDDHKFVQEIKKSSNLVKRVTIMGVVGAIVAFIIAAVRNH